VARTEIPTHPGPTGGRGLTKSRLTTIYLAGFFIGLIFLMALYIFYVQWFVDLLTPAFGFDKAFDIVTWFTPLAWLIMANLVAIILSYLATRVYPLSTDAQEMLYGKFTRSMLLAVIVCLISLIVLDISVYFVNKEWKIVELVPLVLLAAWFFIKKNFRNG
jgi:multisubunit Na+/H+ antiporter MnhB subunit